VGKPQFPEIARGEKEPPANARRGVRKISFEGAGAVDAIVYDRPRPLYGNIIAGPAIIEEVTSTTVAEPDDKVAVNEFGHLIMTFGRR
jgi:N-methylhydantoinase A